jgi:Flp pilus assembly protein TadD
LRALELAGNLAAHDQERALTIATSFFTELRRRNVFRVGADPTDTDTMGNVAALAMSLGRLDTVISSNEYANARDPVNPTGHQILGVAYSNAGRQDEAIESYRTALSLSPGLAGAHSQIGVALLLKGDAAARSRRCRKRPARAGA